MNKKEKEYLVRFAKREVNFQQLQEKLITILPNDQTNFPWAWSIFDSLEYSDGTRFGFDNQWMRMQDNYDRYTVYTDKNHCYYLLVTKEEIKGRVESFIGNYLQDDSYPILDYDKKYIQLQGYIESNQRNVQNKTAMLLFDELGIAYRKEDYFAIDWKLNIIPE